MLAHRLLAAWLSLGAAAAVATMLLYPSIALAGGYDEMPDQGAQALGRGATFTAKADDATALYYNVAGLARQRGTKLQLTANTYFNTQYFARSGTYQDDPADPKTPWGGKPYPVVKSTARPAMIPMLVATTDFGVFDRLTFAAGFFAPSSNGKLFPIGVGGKPAPSRYDFVQSEAVIVYPTIGAGYRVTKQLDLGIAVHAALADLKQLSIAYADTGSGNCKNPEYITCDAEGRLNAKGAGLTASVGGLARISPSFQIGGQVRLPTAINAEGEVTSKLGSIDLKPGPAKVRLEMPWIARFGARYIGMNKKFEQYDLEVDGTFETWGGTKDPTAITTDPTGASTKETRIVSTHHWNNTFSIRTGGAYNLPFEDGILTIRGGAFYDSPTTDSAYTRLDTNTMAKVAGTAGVGYKRGAFTVNLAYAAVASISRTVTDGEVRPSNGAKQGAPVDGQGKLLPAFNNGEYRAFTHILSIGVEVSFDTLFGSTRKPPTFGDEEYEVVTAPPGGTEPAKSDEDDEAKNKSKEKEKENSASTDDGGGVWSNTISASQSTPLSTSVTPVPPAAEEVAPPDPPPAPKPKKKAGSKKNSPKPAASKKSATR